MTRLLPNGNQRTMLHAPLPSPQGSPPRVSWSTILIHVHPEWPNLAPAFHGNSVRQYESWQYPRFRTNHLLTLVGVIGAPPGVYLTAAGFKMRRFGSKFSQPVRYYSKRPSKQKQITPNSSLLRDWNLRMAESPNDIELWLRFVAEQSAFFPSDNELKLRQIKIAARARELNPDSELLALLHLELSRSALSPSTLLEEYQATLAKFPLSLPLTFSYLNATLACLPVDTVLLVAGDINQQWIQERRPIHDRLGILLWTLLALKQAGYAARAWALLYCQLHVFEQLPAPLWETQLDALASDFGRYEITESGPFTRNSFSVQPLSCCSSDPLDIGDVVLFSDLAPHLISLTSGDDVRSCFIPILSHCGVRFHMTHFPDLFSRIESPGKSLNFTIVPGSRSNFSICDLSWFHFSRPSMDNSDRLDVCWLLRAFAKIPDFMTSSLDLYACVALACDLPDLEQLRGGFYHDVFRALDMGFTHDVSCFEWHIATLLSELEKSLIEGDSNCEELAGRLELSEKLGLKGPLLFLLPSTFSKRFCCSMHCHLPEASRNALIQKPPLMWTYFEISFSLLPVVLFATCRVISLRKVTLEHVLQELDTDVNSIHSVYRSVLVIECARIQAIRLRCFPPVPQSYLREAATDAVRTCPSFIKTWLLFASVSNWIIGQYQTEAKQVLGDVLAPMKLFTLCELEIPEGSLFIKCREVLDQALAKFPYCPMLWDFSLNLAEKRFVREPSSTNRQEFRTVLFRAVSSCPWNVDICSRGLSCAQRHQLISDDELRALKDSMDSHHLNLCYQL